MKSTNAVLLPLGTVSEMEVPRQTDRRGAASVNAGRPGQDLSHKSTVSRELAAEYGIEGLFAPAI